MVSGITPERRERIRRYFCTNQRRLHRRFIRTMAVIIFLLSLLTNIFHFLSFTDRAQTHKVIDQLVAERDEARRDAAMSREMLDARGYIQIAVVCVAERRNAFLPKERAEIKALGFKAQYNLVQNPPCEFFNN